MDISDQNFISKVTKQDLCDYLGEKNSTKIKKIDLERMISDKISNKFELARFLKTFEEETGVPPVALEEILQCTKSERLRWQKENKLKIVGYDSFKYGNYPLFSLYQLNMLKPETIEKWREEHELEKRKHRIGQGEKAKKTKEKRNNEKQRILNDLKEQKAEWYKTNYKLSATFELAYWTVWISRLAKEYQVKAYNCRAGNYEKYMNISKEFYEIKNTTVFSLVNSPYAELSIYFPENPDKYSVHFCEEHLEMFRMERACYGYDYFSALDYFFMNQDEIEQCYNCDVKREKNYYTLYYLLIKDEHFPDIHFSFHIPYSIGLPKFGNPNKLPMVKHEEQDGMFRFGRPLIDEEKYLFIPAFVKKQFNKAMETYLYIMEKKNE